MSSPEAFNFGRKIKDLKRSYNKTYVELTSGLKISRERIIQLEEGEREPTEIERRRFAEFYSQPPEELGLIGSGGISAPRPGPSPIRPGNFATPPAGERPPYTPPQPGFSNERGFGNEPDGGFSAGGPVPERPAYGAGGPGPERSFGGGGPERGNFEPRPSAPPPDRGGFNPDRNNFGGGFDNRQQGGGGRFDPNERRPQQGGYENQGQGQNQGGYDRGNYEPRQGGYENRGNFDRGNYEPRQPGNNFQDRRPTGPSNFQDRRPSGPSNFQDRRPTGPGNFQDRPPQRGPGNFQDRPQRPPVGPGRGPDDNDRASKPAPKAPAKPRTGGDKQANGEPKPVMKYTAEQLGDIESAYLRKQRDLKVPLKFTFMNGKEYTGVVTDFTPFTVHILDQTTGEEVILRKLAMAYYRKADAVEEARNAAQAGIKPEEV